MTNRVKRVPVSPSPEKALLSAARYRAKRKGVPFNLTYRDIVIPKRCPILGIALQRGLEGGLDNSPSLDRIVPRRGYVRGNVRVISNRANRIKSDSTPEELARILTYVLANSPQETP